MGFWNDLDNLDMHATSQHLMANGQAGSATITAVRDTGMTINDNPRVKMTVRAEPVGEAPFTVVKSATVSRVRIPRAGDSCVVFYDPSDREGNNGITFDPVPGMPLASAPRSEDDPLDKIAQLGKLRDQGLVTPEEFEAQKKRLLDET